MANSWWEIQILCDPDLEDVIFGRLDAFGMCGASSEYTGYSKLIRGYVPQAQVNILDLAAFALSLRQDALCAGSPIPAVQWNLIDEEDWASNWKAHWQPQNVGDRFLIHPAWLPLPEHTDRLIIKLEPGVAFGTGEHATTQLCLEALEMRLGELGMAEHGQEAQFVADIGCGSGILSVGALMLGAAKVYAADTDPLAVQSTLENRELNGIERDRLFVEQGSVDRIAQMIDAPVDGIVCNILAEVIIDLIPQMGQIAKPSTWGALSGILLDQAKAVTDALEANGWLVAALWKRGEWCCLNIRRS